MMSDLRLYSVNWQDGMLITQRHLVDQERYFEDLARWYALRIGDYYGLVRKSFSGQPALNLNLAVSGNRLRVEVVRCQAVTPDGVYIDIDGSGRYPVRGEAELTGSTMPVYIAVDPAAKKAVGDPDPGEDLPRMPYLQHGYSVHLGQAPNLPEGHYLQVAMLTVGGGEVTYARDYYPPCLTLYSDERLAEKASELRNRLENFLSLSTRAYMAVVAPGALKGGGTGLQEAFKETINSLVYHLAATIDDFVIGPNAGHPLFLVLGFKKLFRVFSTLLNLHPGLKDYLNEQFFTKELQTDIGRFLSGIDGFILSEYNHRDLGAQIQTMDGILDQMRSAIAFLAQTKRESLGEQAVATETLTYAGKTYHNAPYKSSRLEQAGELCYLMIDISEPRRVKDQVVLLSKGLFTDTEWRNMQVRLGLNQARGLGETDPVDVDTVAFGNKVALHPRDMLETASVRQMTLIFRGAPDGSKFANLSKIDLLVYTM
jgi:hypothetical protein